jgi:hypothetical protein
MSITPPPFEGPLAPELVRMLEEAMVVKWVAGVSSLVTRPETKTCGILMRTRSGILDSRVNGDYYLGSYPDFQRGV